MEPFKNLLNPALVQEAAAHLRRHWRGFDAAAFTAQATHGLDALEMKARAMQICAALEATLPDDFDRAAGLLESALAPMQGDEVAGPEGLKPGLRGWILWPAGEYISRRGLAQPERALAALHAITQRFTAEFAIRPLIVQHPALCFTTLQRWTADPSAHVRRLVSEGSRPRLPWGLRLQELVKDPSPTLPLLRALQDDDSEYVRRSVANHLNDIAKDHPALVAAWVKEHLADAPAARRALLKHASRTLVKQGHAPTLKAWGLGAGFSGTVALNVAPALVAVGDKVQLTLSLASSARKAQTLVVDYAVHHVKADGSTSAKVFKGWSLNLPPGGSITLQKSHSMRPVTTRRYHAGQHGITVQVNGREVAAGDFTLLNGS
jgi:3-methyladenine DNA glycosylase AlkC